MTLLNSYKLKTELGLINNIKKVSKTHKYKHADFVVTTDKERIQYCINNDEVRKGFTTFFGPNSNLFKTTKKFKLYLEEGHKCIRFPEISKRK